MVVKLWHFLRTYFRIEKLKNKLLLTESESILIAYNFESDGMVAEPK